MDSDHTTKSLSDYDIDDLNATVLLSHSGRNDPETAFDCAEEIPEGGGLDHRDRFRFVCYFAAGGVGKLSKAKDVVFDRLVAVKSLKEKHCENPKAIKAFLDECRLNAQLDHPSIVPVYSIGKGEEGAWEVVMKLIHGSSLSEFIRMARAAYDKKKVSYRVEQYALASRLEYFLKICEVIGYCHSRKIIHGDLKPNNIMMGQYGEVYIMDWGCARPEGSVPDFFSGTPNYLPPEFFANHLATPLVDIYALGVILFEMSTLLRGSGGNTGDSSGSETLYNIHEPAQWHYQPGLKLAPALRAIIAKAANRDPKQRYQSVNELANDVRHFIYHEEVSAHPDNLLRKGARWISKNQMKTVLTTTAIFAVLCGLLFYSFYQAIRTEERNKTALMQRLKFQSYTDELAGAVERNLFAAQAQILLFADDLIEYSGRQDDRSGKYYENDQYRSPETSPPGMQVTEYYPNPVNLDHSVRFLTGDLTAEERIGADQFLHICTKVINTDFDRSDVRRIDRKRLLSPDCRIQRLFVRWVNGVEYSYPGSFDNPDTQAFSWRWDDPGNHSRGKRIVWGEAYRGNTGAHRIICRYPLFGADGRYLGGASIELRLEKIFEPWILAQLADPVHKFYYADSHRERVVTVIGDKLLLHDKGERFPDGISADDILGIAAKLENNRFRQFQASPGGVSHFVSGAPLSITGGMFIQMIETEVMKTHHHAD